MLKLWYWLRFGKITERKISGGYGYCDEVEFVGRGGRVVGQWAYGRWNPAYPYKGE